MEDMAGEEGLGELEGGLEGDEGADFEVGLEGEEGMAGDGEVDGIILWEGGGLIFFRARKAWRWRCRKKRSFVNGNRSLPVC